LCSGEQDRPLYVGTNSQHIVALGRHIHIGFLLLKILAKCAKRWIENTNLEKAKEQKNGTQRFYINRSVCRNPVISVAGFFSVHISR
jgi:hypothetical protein